MSILFGGFGHSDLRWAHLLAAEMGALSSDRPFEKVERAAHGSLLAICQHTDFFPLAEPVVDHESERLFAVQGYLWTDHGFPIETGTARQALSAAGNRLLNQGEMRLPSSWGGLFNLVAMDLKSGRLVIANDLSGLMPLFYGRTSEGGLLFASHSAPLARALRSPIDAQAVVQQCCFHYSIGSRSLFQGVSRLNPGETLEFLCQPHRLTLVQQSSAYGPIDRYGSDDEAVEALWADFISGTKQISRPTGPNGILLSGGFDTRMNVVALRHFSKPIVSVTFGDPDNYEVEIAKRVANLSKADSVIHDPAPDCQLTEHQIDRLVTQVESVNFPSCWSGAQTLRSHGAISGATGYGGETFLGGQAFYMLGDRFSSSARLSLALRRSLGLASGFETPLDSRTLASLLDVVHGYHERQMAPFDRRFASSGQQALKDARDQLRDEIEVELLRMCESGPETLEQLCERFHLEHHVLKHFGRQELTVSSVLPLAMPTLHPPFFVRCSNLPPSRKVDHGLYLKLVKKHWDDYAKLPTANIPISLRYPATALWLARGFRASSERLRFKWANLRSSGVKTDIARTGWADFETWMRQGTFLDDCLGWIDPEIIDPLWLSQKIRKLKTSRERLYSGQDLLTWITVSRMAKAGTRKSV